MWGPLEAHEELLEADGPWRYLSALCHKLNPLPLRLSISKPWRMATDTRTDCETPPEVLALH